MLKKVLSLYNLCQNTIKERKVFIKIFFFFIIVIAIKIKELEVEFLSETTTCDTSGHRAWHSVFGSLILRSLYPRDFVLRFVATRRNWATALDGYKQRMVQEQTKTFPKNVIAI